jgi:hypothetical protein
MFHTEDCGLIAALNMNGFEPVDHVIDERGLTWFYYTDSPELQQLRRDYRSGTLRVPAMTYFVTVRALVRRLRVNHPRA